MTQPDRMPGYPAVAKRPLLRSRRWKTLGAAATAILLTMGASVGGWQWAGSERTDLAQWLMAGAALSTLLAAVAAAWFAYGAYQLEVNRESRYAEDRRRAQAEHFSGWCGEAEDKVEVEGKVYWSGLVDVIYLRNASNLPMNRVFGVVRTADGTNLGSLEIGMVPPSDDLKVVNMSSEIAHSVDAAKREHERRAAEMAGTSIIVPEAFQLQVELWFTDAANVSWRRHADGELVPISS